jgi:hypothetical protein
MLLLAFCLLNHSSRFSIWHGNHALCQGRIMTLTCGIVGFFCCLLSVCFAVAAQTSMHNHSTDRWCGRCWASWLVDCCVVWGVILTSLVFVLFFLDSISAVVQACVCRWHWARSFRWERVIIVFPRRRTSLVSYPFLDIIFASDDCAL